MWHTFSKKITRSNLRAFLERHASDGYTLDVGASESAYSDLFPNRVGLDKVEKEGVDVVGDAHELPFEDGTFENVLCTEVLEHLHTPQKAIDEMRRVLKPDGRLVLTTRFIYPLHDSPHDYFRFTKYGLRHLFRDWDVISLEKETDTPGTIAVLFQTLAYKASLRGGRLGRWALFLVACKLRWLLRFVIKEEVVSGRNAPKHVEDAMMTSGYYIVCKKK